MRDDGRGDTHAVYELRPDGPPAVPTGKIFPRFKEGVEAASRREEIGRAGYEIIRTPPYAASEPQMLAERSHR